MIGELSCEKDIDGMEKDGKEEGKGPEKDSPGKGENVTITCHALTPDQVVTKIFGQRESHD
jgi:hypothetical protein